MKRLALLPPIVLALAACSDTTTGPISVPGSLPGPQFVLTINEDNAPEGTHFQTGAATCDFDSILLTVICAAYELGGVGNIDATADLALNFTATINCTNRGGELVEVHSQDASRAHATALEIDRNATGSVRFGSSTGAGDMSGLNRTGLIGSMSGC